jgi:urease accessory protein
MPSSEPAAGSPEPVSPELVAMMLADARFPSGGYAQSGGLEPAVRAGLTGGDATPADVVRFAEARLRTVTAVDAGTAVLSRHLALHADDPSSVTLQDVEEAWAARTPSRPLREAARLTGRGYLRLAVRLWPEVLTHLRRDAAVPRPVVVGVVGAVTGLGAVQVARLVGYDDVSTVASAALKLLPLDPAEVAAWTLSLHPQVEALALAVASVTDPADIPDRGAPALDSLAERHRRAEMRLFHV